MNGMTNCKACKKEIAKGVKKCPHCGKDQRNFFMKHKIITGILVLVILGSIGSATNNNKPTKVGENKAVSGSVASTSSTPDTKKNETKTFKIGDIVKLKGLNITVNKVAVVVGDEYTKPKDGNEFLAIDCTIENISDKETPISSMIMFKVVDKDGRACEYSLMGITAAKAGQLDGTIGVGRKISGAYVVEVVKGTKGLQLEFSGELLSTGQVIVNLN